jgi:integrase
MARNIGVKRLGNTLKPLAGSRVQISPPANSIYGDKQGFGNQERKSFKREDFERFLEKIRQVSMQVSWHQLQQMQSVLHKTQTKRFAGKRRTPKYGSLLKAFTGAQITQFFRVIDDDKFRLIFQYQAQLGLRIGEAVKVNVKDINFETREITLKTEKAEVIDTLLAPNQLFRDTLAFISKHEKEIEKAIGCIFFRSPERSFRAEHFVEQNYGQG